MKHGHSASKELAEFFKERYVVVSTICIHRYYIIFYRLDKQSNFSNMICLIIKCSIISRAVRSELSFIMLFYNSVRLLFITTYNKHFFIILTIALLGLLNEYHSEGFSNDCPVSSRAS